MALPDTGKISHKDIMTEFEHPRNDFKLSGDGAPILQRANNAKVAESDFYGLKKGGDMIGANFGQVIVSNSIDGGQPVITENGYQWTEVHSSIGQQYASGGDRMLKNWKQSGQVGYQDPRGKLHVGVTGDDFVWGTTNAAPRNFGSAGGGSHGKYEGYWPKYNGNYSGQNLSVTNVDNVTPDQDGSVWMSLSFDDCCPSYHGYCIPSPCYSNADGGDIHHAPSARLYIAFAYQHNNNQRLYKSGTNGTSFNYPRGGQTAYTQAQNIRALNNKIIAVGGGKWFIWDTTDTGTSGTDAQLTGVYAVTKFKGKFYYGFGKQHRDAGGKRAFRSSRFPPTDKEIVNGLDFAGEHRYARFFHTPDGDALLYGGNDANGKTAWYATKDGVTWQKTYTSHRYTGGQGFPVTSAQLWHPADF